MKTNHDLIAHIFLCLALATCNRASRWFLNCWEFKVVQDCPNINNIIFSIQVMRIIKLMTKHEYSRCSNKFCTNTISNVWRAQRRIICRLRWGRRPSLAVNCFKKSKNQNNMYMFILLTSDNTVHIAILQWICIRFPQAIMLRVIRFSIPIMYVLACTLIF